ncbi:MAG: hypothetical protein ACI88L_000522 [Candidatus Paceibacteria bacterium]|jgi:hypothetical protein
MEEQEKLILEKKKDILRESLSIINDFVMKFGSSAEGQSWKRFLKENPEVLLVKEGSMFDELARGVEISHENDQGYVHYVVRASYLYDHFPSKITRIIDLERYHAFSQAYNSIFTIKKISREGEISKSS